MRFVGAEGEDLLTPAEQVWDLEGLRFPVEQDFDWAHLESQLEGPFFKDKKQALFKRLIQVVLNCGSKNETSDFRQDFRADWARSLSYASLALFLRVSGRSIIWGLGWSATS